MANEYIDWLGNTIVPGDHVVYPGRQSSSLWMNHAKVLEISDEKESSWGRKYRTMRVQHTEKSHYGWTKGKIVSLCVLERVTKVNVG